MNFLSRRFWEGIVVGSLTGVMLMTFMEREEKNSLSQGLQGFSEHLQKLSKRMNEFTVFDNSSEDDSIDLTMNKRDFEPEEKDMELGTEMGADIKQQMKLIKKHLDNLDFDQKSD